MFLAPSRGFGEPALVGDTANFLYSELPIVLGRRRRYRAQISGRWGRSRCAPPDGRRLAGLAGISKAALRCAWGRGSLVKRECQRNPRRDKVAIDQQAGLG